jgi:hypothetical protein
MSTDTFEAELDDILGELTSDFTKKRKKKKPSSASSTFHKPHDIGAVSDTLRDEDDQQEESRQTMNPKVAKKKQEGLQRNLIKKTFSSGNSKLPKL